MFLNHKIILLFLLLFLISCTHLKEKIHRLPYHTSKSDALDILGRPFQIKRVGSLDHWIYKFKFNGREYTKIVIFKEGHFLKSKRRQPYPDPESLLEESDSLEEYEKALRFIKRSRRHKK